MLMSHLPPVPGASALQAAPAQAALLNLHGALEFTELWTSLQGLFETVVPHDTLVMSVILLGGWWAIARLMASPGDPADLAPVSVSGPAFSEAGDDRGGR